MACIRRRDCKQGATCCNSASLSCSRTAHSKMIRAADDFPMPTAWTKDQEPTASCGLDCLEKSRSNGSFSDMYGRDKKLDTVSKMYTIFDGPLMESSLLSPSCQGATTNRWTSLPMGKLSTWVTWVAGTHPTKFVSLVSKCLNSASKPSRFADPGGYWDMK